MFNLIYNKADNTIELAGTNSYGDTQAVVKIIINSNKDNNCCILKSSKADFLDMFTNSPRISCFGDKYIQESFKNKCCNMIDYLNKQDKDNADKYVAIGVIDLSSRLLSRVATKPIGMNSDLIKGWFHDWNNEAEVYKVTIKKLVSVSDQA